MNRGASQDLLHWARVQFVMLVALVAMAISPSFAQAPYADQAAKLDNVRANLDQAEQTLKRPDLSDAALEGLRATINPLSDITQAVIKDLQPRLDAIKARLDQLGPKPAADAPPENPDVAADREGQQKQYDALDALLKRASLLSTQLDQDSDAITSRRREIFTRALFARTQSVFDPRLWVSIAKDAPHNVRASRIVAGDWFSSSLTKLGGARSALAGAGVLVLALAYWLLARLARRVGARDPRVHDPSPLRVASAAAWVGLWSAALPIFAAVAFFVFMRSFDFPGGRMEPLASALVDAVARVALAIAGARALLAPDHVNWRRIALSDSVARRLTRLAVAVATLVSVIYVFEAWLEVIGADLQLSIALRGCGAIVVAIIMTLALRDLAAVEESEEDCLPPRIDVAHNWAKPLRGLAWCVVIVVFGAAVAGFTTFASFLVDQAIWVVFIGVVFYLAHDLIEETLATSARPEATVSRAIMDNIGLRRESVEQIAVLLSGAATIALALAAITLALAPWGVESDDLFGSLRAAFFGFKVGEVTISLSSIFIALAILASVWALTRTLRRWLESRFLPLTKLDSGLRNSILTSIGYLGVLAGFALSLGYLGLSIDKLAIIAGGLSLGIGFGLQSIVNNFVSGLILLWERAIRVGDWVVIGSDQGYVRRINVRSTEIETFDRATMIVPNSNIVSGVVKNWVRTDRVGRVLCTVPVAPHAEPELVRRLLLESAQAHELVQKFPAPVVVLTDLANNALKFDLICFVADVETASRVKSDLNFDILRRLREAGIALFSAPFQWS